MSSRPKGSQAGVEHFFGVTGIGDRALHRDDPAAVGSRSHLIEGRLGPPGHFHRGSSIGEELGDPAADAATPAGHDGRFAGEVPLNWIVRHLLPFIRCRL